MSLFLYRLFLLQDTQKPTVENIKKKLEEAPDSGYQIGLIIGAFLPMIILVVLAYFLFFKMKKKS